MKVCTDACLFGGFVAGFYEQRNEPAPNRCLDAGAGTGLLSLMMAQKLRHTSFHAIEPDFGSFSDAKFNFEKSPFSERLKIEQLRFQEFGEENHDAFPMIVCNPPFFSDHLKSPDPHRNQAMHLGKKEWKNWLFFLKNSLSENGLIWLLLSENLWQESQIFLSETGLYCHLEMSLHQKKNKNWRKVLALGKQVPKENQQTETLVYQEKGTFVPMVKNWISDYYLFE